MRPHSLLAKSVEDQAVIEKLRAALGVAKLENEALRKEISLLQTRAQVGFGFWFTKRRWPESCAMLSVLRSLRTRHDALGVAKLEDEALISHEENSLLKLQLRYA